MRAYTAHKLKTENRMAAFSLLRDQDTLSRIDLAGLLGISPPTAGKIMDYFFELGLIEFAGMTSAEFGRPAVKMRLNERAFFHVGVAFEGTMLNAGIFDLNAKPLATVRTDTKLNDSEHVGLGTVTGVIYELTQKCGIDTSRIAGIGVGIPGILSPDLMRIEYAPKIGITEPVDISLKRTRLENRFSCPVSVLTSVNCEALGELNARSDDYCDLAYFSIGSSPAAAFIVDSKLLLGGRGRMGEIGYSRPSPRSYLYELINAEAAAKYLNVPSVFDARTASPEDIAVACERICEPLAICISNLGAALDMRNVVVGGIVAKALDPVFIETLNRALARISHFPLTAEPSVCENADITGAAIHAMDAGMERVLHGGEQFSEI